MNTWILNDVDELKSNLKLQLEKLNQTSFSDREFSRTLTYLEGGTIYDKATKFR